MVSSLFRVLRNILKSLRSDHEDLEEVYARLAVSSLLKLPWDVFPEIRESQTSLGRTNSENGDSLKLRNDRSGCKHILLGTIVQVLCSLVEHKDYEADQGGPLKDIVVYCRLTSMIPQILCCCFPKCCTENQLSQYFKHKTLLLMIRLSFYEFWHKAYPLSWLRLVIEYFGDLVFHPITNQSDGINPLEGSPFLASFSDGEGVYPIRKRHLQRQALFLYLRCCFTLLDIRDGNQDCIYPAPGLSSACENSSFTVSLELSEWLQKCALLEMSVDSESHSRKCNCFALLFLQLYMEEDDMLFQMLLQLLDAPIPIMQVWSLEDRETYKGLLFHMSRIFHPIHLLHLLLLLIHYDHLLLIDYLISKDTGVHCLHYLLRCLRTICKSWKTFVEFSIHEGELIIQQNKRRKVSRDEEEPCDKQSSSSTTTVAERQNVRKNSRNRSKENSTLVNCFEDAKKCLLSLKRTVEDLHRKKLFPYNPKPLVKSLTRFQELCSQENL